MKNKSYKKILALTLAAALVGGNAVATFATESTTDTGVTASEDRILGDSKEKPIKVTFKMSGDIGTAYFEATKTTESSDEVEVGKYSNLPKISLPVDCELTGWEVSSDDAVKQPVKTLAANQTTYTYDTVKGLKNPVITAVIKKKAETVQKTVVATFNAPAGATLVKAEENGGEYVPGSNNTAIQFTATSNDQKFNLPTVTTPEGYEFTGWTGDTNAGTVTLDAGATEIQGLIDYGFFYQDETTGYVTFTGTSKEKETVKEADATLYVHYVDENNVPLDIEGGNIVTLTKKGKVGEKATFSGTDFEAPEGYTLVENDLSREVAYGADDNINVKVKKLEEEKEARDVIVNFNVDPEKGEFTDPADAKVVTFTIKEDDEEQYNVPTVKAKEGYVFTGWEVQGEETGHWDADAKTFGVTGLAHFPEGSNEGYVTVTAQFEEVKPEVAVANANVVVDPDKGSFDGYDGATTLNNEHLEEADYTLGYLPTVTANDGYKWTGWVVTNKAGETILDLDTNASSIAFDYGVADTYTVTAKFEEVKPEVAVANANVVVDPVKGSFDGYDGATTLNNEHLEEADYTLGYLPTVTANDGYKWTGWVVTNKAGETILDLDTNASSIAFDYGVADTYTVTAKFETVTPEQPGTPEQPEQPGTPEQPAKPEQPATDNKTDKTDKTDKKDDKKTDKKTDKKSDKKTDKKSDKKKTPKTGDTSTPIVYMVTLIGAAVAAVLALIKRRKF